MTQLLERAFTEASKLPEPEQDAVASLLLAELESEQRRALRGPAVGQPHGDPMAALNFAREHGLEEGSTADWMKRLRDGDED